MKNEKIDKRTTRHIRKAQKDKFNKKVIVALTASQLELFQKAVEVDCTSQSAVLRRLIKVYSDKVMSDYDESLGVKLCKIMFKKLMNIANNGD